MTTKIRLTAAEESLAEDLKDPEFRAGWERTVLARAVALAVLDYRTKHNLTQTALANKLGVRQPHVARLEIGEHNPSMEMLQRLSEKLGLRFVIEVAPPEQRGSRLQLPAGVDVIEDVATGTGGRLLVAAG